MVDLCVSGVGSECPSDLTDEQWVLVESLRPIVDAIFYVVTSCAAGSVKPTAERHSRSQG
ncbi:hypothetical protein ASD48_21075 [Streptomyces sp. Root1310]|nr:hypothetical protein ASD48_21075 [Streptomyces sp. Root1310]